MADTPLLIAGLGNPGESYARHRHNVGFMAADAIAGAHKFAPWRARFHGQVSEGKLAGRKVLLLKPMTFMNESGRAVGEALRFLKIPLAQLVVIYDEIDLAPGKLKVKTGGGDAGHNGLRSITAALGPDYRRVRIGVGHPGAAHLVSGYVLHNFSKADGEWLTPLLSALADAAPLLAQENDAGFLNSIALAIKPQRPSSPNPGKPKKEEKPDGV